MLLWDLECTLQIIIKPYQSSFVKQFKKRRANIKKVTFMLLLRKDEIGIWYNEKMWAEETGILKKKKKRKKLTFLVTSDKFSLVGQELFLFWKAGHFGIIIALN